MNVKRYSLSVITGFIFIFIVDFLYHGVLLAPLYEETKELWWTLEEMERFFPLATTIQFLMTAVLAFIFTRNFEDRGFSEGLRFGIMFGLLFGLAWFGMIAYMPITITLAAAWFVGSLIKMVGLGCVFALTYRN